MKKFLLILTLFFLTGSALHAQEEDNNNDKIRDKMTEFIQRRLNLSRDEAEKFSPVFLRYFREWRTTLRDFRGGPKLDLQQKIIEIQLRYRNQFKDIIGEKRSNQVYEQQQIFIEEVRRVQQQRFQNRENRPFRRNR